MELKKKTIIWEENTEPPKNYFWVKPDGKVYEWTLEKEDWAESETIQLYKDPTAPEYSDEEPSSETTSAITAYEEKQTAAGKTINPTATITVDYTKEESIPETITLPETTHPMTLKGDFSQNESTTIESAGEIEKVTINNTGDAANIVIDLPSSSATISGEYDSVTVQAVADNTLNINTSCKIKTLVVLKGNVIINNAEISDNVENLVVVGGSVKANDEIEAVNANSFVAKPRKVKVIQDMQIGNLGFAILANGHYIYDLGGHTVEVTRQGYGGILVRGVTVKVDFVGEGTFTNNGTTPLVWCSDKESEINIYSGTFIAKDHIECLYAENGTINVYGGEFHNKCAEGQKNFLLNCKDANYKAGTAKIVVYGGKFYGFDPAANAAESSDNTTSFVAEGYHSVDMGEYFEVVKDE